MPIPTELRSQIEQCAREFYSQALNLTLANPLLRLPSTRRGAKYIPLATEDCEIVADLLAESTRKIAFVGQDAPGDLLELAATSRRPGSRLCLRLKLEDRHELVESTLRSIARKHDELLEKRGLPCAYIFFGALKWYGDDGQACVSPLLLVPVEMDDERDPSVLRVVTTISASERDSIVNPALRALLRSKHGIELPELEDEFEPTWSSITAWLESQAGLLTRAHPDWSVERRLGLGLFDCGAIAADCEVQNWANSPAENDVLRRVLCATHVEQDPPITPEFMPPSLVLEADGSQLGALQTVARGASVVLHGPPGSGKSQTIVNLIAQAMSSGKSVLFVAQKPEAAHVVHRRLAECGLDPFCTMLVPTGTSRNTKTAVLESLRRRDSIDRSGANVHEAQRAQLQQHVDLLDKHAGALGIALPQLHMTAREAVAELAVHSMNGVHALGHEHVVVPTSIEQVARTENALRVLAQRRSEISEPTFAALGGLRARAPGSDGADAGFQFQRAMDGLGSAVEAIRSSAKNLSEVDCPPLGDTLWELEQFRAALPDLDLLGSGDSMVRAARLRHPQALRALELLVQVRDELAALQARIPLARETIVSGQLPSTARWNDVIQVTEQFEVHGLTRAAGAELAETARQIAGSLETAAAALGQGAVFRIAAQPVSVDRWWSIAALLDALGTPGAARSFLVNELAAAPRSVDDLNQVAGLIRRIHDLEGELSQSCLLDRLPPRIELRVSQSAISARGRMLSRLWGSVTDRRYRDARRSARQVLLPHVPRGEWASVLSRCVELAQAKEMLPDAAARAGLRVNHSRDPGRWSEAAAWFVVVAERANAAQVPLTEVLAIAGAIERGDLRRGEDELLLAATALARRRDLAIGIGRSVPVGAATPMSLSASLRRLAEAIQRVNEFADALTVARSETLGRVAALGARFCGLRDGCVALEQSVAAKELFAGEFLGADTDPREYVAVSRWLDQWEKGKPRPRRDIRDWLLETAEVAPHRAGALQRNVVALEGAVGAANARIKELLDGFAFDGAAEPLTPTRSKTVEQLLNVANLTKAHQAGIKSIFVFGEQFRKCAELAGDRLLADYASGDLRRDRLVETYRRSIIEALLRRDSQLAPVVSADRVALEEAIRDLPRLDSEIRKLNARRLIGELARRSAPLGKAVGRVREYTELALIRHLIGLSRPRFEVQDLFARARNAMRTLQPCLIATPDAVSEFLPREPGMFDLLIMDEASQVPPAAAFGSLGRSQQAVIVGDPKQLPPTRFFLGGNGLSDESDDEDMRGLTDVESILERAISSLKSVYLRGHYRSRHHSLIAFSNRRFYENQLVVAPNICPRDSQYGVTARFVEGARYSAGLNEMEAERVASAAMEHLRASQESLGIVAFNAKQAELIENRLEAIAGRSRESFELYSRARTGSSPLFIRNLESVQGDERDVIFISYTYGPDAESGQVYQRFGPILTAGGERRLNVLVTRAKNRVEVFHSMRPSDIKAEGAGAATMREYLEYALQAPDADFAGGEFESDFEEEVARAIEALSSDLIVTPQVHCAGFRIDLGVLSKRSPGRFLLGVECDGATYHSSRSARDRDLVRQAILEHRGWKIHRVWSTAWWKNPEQERQRLALAIEAAIRSEPFRS